MRKCSISAFSHFLIFALSYSHILTLHSAPVQQGYTNHAGNVIAGFPVALTKTQVRLSEEVRGKSEEVGAKSEEVRGKSEEGRAEREETSSLPAPRSSLYSPTSSLPAPRSTLPAPRSSLYSPRSSLYSLSIFPESEQRRIAADFGEPRLPVEVKRAIAGAEKAMARSRKRAEKGLCTKENGTGTHPAKRL